MTKTERAARSEKTPVTIKKYANRRLYNTASSSYVTLENLAEMVRQGEEFVVYDAKSGEDITRSVLTQIIFELESKGQNLLPIGFLRQLIGLYGDSLQTLVPSYLDFTMRAFGENQERMRRQFSEAVGGMFPFAHWEQIGRQNMAMFERAAEIFAPFAADGSPTRQPEPHPPGGGKATPGGARQEGPRPNGRNSGRRPRRRHRRQPRPAPS